MTSPVRTIQVKTGLGAPLARGAGADTQGLSDRCGIDVATLSKLENGKQANPTLFTMLLYVGAVGKQLRFFVGDRPSARLTVSEVREGHILKRTVHPKVARARLRRNEKTPVKRQK